MRTIALLAFWVNFFHLVAVQVFLRRLQIALPVDLTAWTLLLVLQFGFSALIVASLPWWQKKLAWTRFPSVVVALKAVALLLALFVPAYSLVAAIAYFAFASAELALLFMATLSANQNSNLARTNVFISLGAAVGLYLAEKMLFRRMNLQSLLGMLILAQVFALWLWQKTLQETMPPHAHSGIFPEKNPTGALLQIFFAGFILFSGLLLAHRIFRIYLLDTADIIAEITVFSLLAAALISYLIARNKSVSEKILAPLATLSGVLFITALVHVDYLLVLPREFLILLTLLPLVAVTTTTYLNALAAAPSARTLAQALAINLLGSLAGAIIFGYFAIPGWGIEKSFLLFAALFLLWQIARLFAIYASQPLVRSMALGGAFLLLVVIFFTLQSPWLTRQMALLVERVAPGETIVDSAETPQDIWLLTEKRRGTSLQHHRLIRNSHSMSGSLYPSRRYMKLMAYLGFLYARQSASALNIGYGTGLSAQALTELPFAKIDVIDISSEIVRLASLLHEREHTSDPIRDARVAYHLGGARHFLKNTQQRYDVITGEPPPPSNSSIAYLYTKEFYETVRDHLSEGGVFTYWLPTHSVADHSAETIWETFCSVFLYCDLYAGSESNLLMIGYTTKEQIPLKQRLDVLDKTRFARDTGFAAIDAFSLLLQSRDTATEPVSAKILSDNFAYIEEDFPANKKRFWALAGLPFTGQKKQLATLLVRRFHTEALPEIFLRPVLIYSADSAFDPYRALRSLEALYPQGISFELALWLLGEDPGITPPVENTQQNFSRSLARHLAEKKISAARVMIDDALKKSAGDEYTYALKILTDRISGKDANVVRQEAIAFSRRLPRVSESFARYAGF